MLALDFFTADLLNATKVHVLAVVEHGIRRIRVLGATPSPAQSWVVQQARNLLMDLKETVMSVTFVLHDRATSFTAALGAVFQAAGIRVIPLRDSGATNGGIGFRHPQGLVPCDAARPLHAARHTEWRGG